MNQHLFTERQLANCYTHYIYRNTIIEKFHTERRCLNSILYKKMYRVVYNRVKKVNKYSKYLYLLDCGENMSQELDKIPEDSVMSVIRFIKDIVFNSYMGHNWDEAEALDELPDNGIASFILSGKFKECCNNNEKLSDQTMYYINKDIHNRIYTLIINGLL